MGINEDKLRFAVEDKTSPHVIIPPIIARNSYVLDVGCNVGYIGEYLIQNKNCVCDGVDIDAAFLKEAKIRGYKNVFNVDLSCGELKIKQKYDYILLIDILEHLPNPEKVLESLVSRNLKEGGKAIICLPNIARFEYRFSHLLGKFDYEASRILHRGHLRFFTLDSGKKMIKSSGLRINKVLTTGLNVKIKIFPQLTAFQFIYVCEKAKVPIVCMDVKKYYHSEESVFKNNTGYSEVLLGFVLGILQALNHNNTHNLNILDVGCNDGMLTEKYARYGNILGIDINKYAVKKCAEKGIPALQCSIETLPKKYKRSFDIVIAANIIEHIFDTDDFIANIWNLLKPGGILILSTPNLASLGRRFMLIMGFNPYVEYSTKLPKEAFNVGHIRYYTCRDIVNQLEAQNFKDIKVSGDAINLLNGIYIPYVISRHFPNLSANLLAYARKPAH